MGSKLQQALPTNVRPESDSCETLENEEMGGLISHTSLRPGRRRTAVHRRSIVIMIWSTFLLCVFCAPALASPAPWSADTRTLETSLVEAAGMDDVPKEILLERRLSPVAELHRRQDFSNNPPASSSSKKSSTSTTGKSGTSTTAGPSGSSISSPNQTSSGDSNTTAGIETAPTPTNSALPIAFDGGLGTNFTASSCPAFMKSMIANKNFTSCVPFSALLQNSMSFFDASRSLSAIDQTLNAACGVSFPQCSSLMSFYALGLRSPSACSDDFNRQNPMVRQAYNALLAYDVSYHASCLKSNQVSSNSNSQQYCFANAVTNASNPTDTYVYYLPLGIPLPGGSQPTCDQCLQETMAIFAGQAGNKTQPLSLTYVNAAQQVNMQCGPKFVNASVPNQNNTGSGTGNAGSTFIVPTTSTWFCSGLLTYIIYTVLFTG